MRFGVGFLPGPAPAGQSTSIWFDRLLRLACRADEMGYEHVQLTGFPLSVEDGYEADPVPLLSAISVLTVGIRVGVAATVPAREHALELAERLSILDHLSHGRLDVSFDPNDRPSRPGFSPNARRDRFADGVDICRRLWSGHRAGSESEPRSGRSYQSPHPPIFVALPADLAACADAGRAGYHLQIVSAAISVAERREMLAAYRAGRNAASLTPGRVRLRYTCYLAEDDQFGRADEDRGVLCGSPAQVRDQVAGIADSLGEDVCLQIDLAPVPGSGIGRALELFAEQVMPYFSGDPADVRQGA